MRLVGATNTFIKMPFIIEGMLIGLISALIAFGGLWVAYNYATQFIMTNPSSWLEIAIGSLINFKYIAHYMLAGFHSGGCGQGMHGEALWEFPLFHLLAGGAILGAVYMATDYSTSPMTHTGMLIYGVGIGIITVLIRLWGAYPEGMSFAILIMNSVVPLINKYVKPRRFGLK